MNERLTALLRREMRSLLQYARQAELWADEPSRPILDTVIRAADDEKALLDRLAEQLRQADLPVPRPGSFPLSFTGVNYTAIRSVLPRVIEEYRRHVSAMETDRNVIPPGEWTPTIDELLRRKRDHLASLDRAGS